ncbi:acetylxylan esterase [bacterium]|nr:acetylxylan esterase [bacterium]
MASVRLEEALRSFNSDVLPAADRQAHARALEEDVDARVQDANRRDAQAWARVRGRGDWEAFVTPRIEALRRSLGDFPPAPKDPEVRVTGAAEGEGYRIENLIYESRRGLPVPANLYLPSPLRERMPGILIVHSHHNPKAQGELQDMGMTWARQECAVLVMDQLGHGERRQHDPGPRSYHRYGGTRQDYRFRYINGIQLHLIGESLIGWMVWDVMRGVDVLLGRPGVDRDRILLIGAVAGGGVPAGVAAALDPRITCVAPFDFGGVSVGKGSWESTRNLHLSGRDGFLPWVVVASVAPRCLISAHEFARDRDRDPAWERLRAVFGFYGAEARLAYTQGHGPGASVPYPEASHCNQVGPVQRKAIYPLLEGWFGIPAPEREYQARHPDREVTCLTPEAMAGRPVRLQHELYAEIGASRSAAMRDSLAGLTPEAQRRRLRQAWGTLLGDIEPRTPRVERQEGGAIGEVRVEKLVLEVDPHILVPVALWLPPSRDGMHAVLALSQDGKGRFLSERAGEVADLLAAGIAVCLPDLRGTGETRLEETRAPSWNGAGNRATVLASTEVMLGQTLLGSRLRDVRSVLGYLRARRDLTISSFSLWGDSFAPPNPGRFPDPLLSDEPPPAHSEPVGGILALLGALYEEDVRAVAARGMLGGYQLTLRDRFCYLPYDVVIPGALRAGDLCDVAAALAPRPLRLERLVDGRNCLLSQEDADRLFEPARHAYREAPHRFCLHQPGGEGVAAWLVAALKR